MSDTDPNDEVPSPDVPDVPTPETHDSSSPPPSDTSSDTSSESDGMDTPAQTSEASSSPPPSEAGASEEEDDETESQPAASSSSSALPETPPTLHQARLFLRDPTVARETPARKAAFLAGKGLSGGDIDTLLKEVQSEEAAPEENKSKAAAAAPPTLPPIVTYPEFVANATPQPPPPLVTPQVLANTLYGTVATSSLLYAAAKLVIGPMVDALTDARADLHATASTNLTALNEKLEGVVSVVPSAATATREAEPEIEIDDASSASSYDDPTEVFHRDIGVQTSLPPSPALRPTVTMDSTVPNPEFASSSMTTPSLTASQRQADRLASLVESVRDLSQGWVGSADLRADIKTTVKMFREDVDKLSRPPAFTYGGGSGGMYNYGSGMVTAGGTAGNKFPGYVNTTRNEPDDEIRKAKENIRRVKGALLSTRTFPTAR